MNAKMYAMLCKSQREYFNYFKENFGLDYLIVLVYIIGILKLFSFYEQFINEQLTILILHPKFLEESYSKYTNQRTVQHFSRYKEFILI